MNKLNRFTKLDIFYTPANIGVPVMYACVGTNRTNGHIYQICRPEKTKLLKYQKHSAFVFSKYITIKNRHKDLPPIFVLKVQYIAI